MHTQAFNSPNLTHDILPAMPIDLLDRLKLSLAHTHTLQITDKAIENLSCFTCDQKEKKTTFLYKNQNHKFATTTM